MIQKKIVVALSLIPLTLAGWAFASESHMQNTDAATQAQLTQIQDQISAIQAQLTQESNSHPALSHREHILGKGIGNYLQDDDVTPGYNLEEDYPSTTFAVDLLQHKDKYGVFTFGGYLEQDTQYFNGSAGMPHGSQVALTTANVDVMSNVNTWTTAFVSAGIIGANNMQLQLNKGFVTFGNLQKSPLYVSFGRNYVPFGSFAGNGPWSANLTRILFRSSEIDEVILGAQQHHLGNSLTLLNSNSGSTLSNFAYSVTYENMFRQFDYTLGGGYLNDIRGTTGDALSAQYGSKSTTTPDSRRMPATDVNGSVSYGVYSFSSELLSLTHAPIGQNGKPRSWYFNGAYAPMIMGDTTIFDVSFSQSTHFNNVTTGINAPLVSDGNNNANLPGTVSTGVQRMWIASVSREVLPNLVPGLEYMEYNTYAHQHAYAWTLDVSLFF